MIVGLVVSAAMYGQQNFASLSFGASLPLGDYTATESLASSGYAKTGGTIKFDAGFFPANYFGIAGSFTLRSNYAIRESLLEDMIHHIENSGSAPASIPEEANIILGTGFWSNVSLYIGPDFSIRASQRLYLDFRIVGGLTFVKPPEQELLIEYKGEHYHSFVSNNRVTLGWGGGVGIRYKINDALALRLAVDYSQARAKFEYNFDLFAGLIDDIPPVDAQFQVRTLEPSIGLAYSF